MMIHIQGTGPLLVVVLIVIAIVQVCLLLLAAAIGSVKPKKAWLCIGLVVLGITCVLGLYGRSGGEFPRLIRGRVLRRPVPVKLLAPFTAEPSKGS